MSSKPSVTSATCGDGGSTVATVTTKVPLHVGANSEKVVSVRLPVQIQAANAVQNSIIVAPVSPTPNKGSGTRKSTLILSVTDPRTQGVTNQINKAVAFLPGKPNIIRNSKDAKTASPRKVNILARGGGAPSSEVKNIRGKPSVGRKLDLKKEEPSPPEATEITIEVNGPTVVKKEVLSPPIERPNEEVCLDSLLKPLGENGQASQDNNAMNCRSNEFGGLEITSYVKADPENHDDDIDLTCKEELSPPKNGSMDSNRLLCCSGCGRYGMSGDFVDAISCSPECQQKGQEKLKEMERKERELVIQKRRREAKRKEREKERKEKERQERIKCLEEKKKEREEEKANEGDDDHEEEVEDNGENVNVSKNPNEHYNSSYPWHHTVVGFTWNIYLMCSRAKAAPVKFFREPQFPKPLMSPPFEPGMALEAIDPEHPALVCAVSVSEVLGARLRLHFDGYSESYDFWEDTTSPNIFPIGWAASRGQRLMPPKGWEGMFEWKKYLQHFKMKAAPKDCFYERAELPDVSGWEIGMKLEAIDKANTSLVCVATVANILDGRALIHFDGWEVDYDYWVEPKTSAYVHPVGWCQEKGFELIAPKGYEQSVFSWPNYMAETQSRPVPASAFGNVPEISPFKKSNKMEVVDKRNPILIRVATVAQVLGRQVKIHFDGWPEDYDLWFDDSSPLLHPPRYCSRSGHPLMPPLTSEEVAHFRDRSGCPTPGCRGIGHIKGSRFTTHSVVSVCPYAPQNMNAESKLTDRLATTSGTVGSLSRICSTEDDSDANLGRIGRERKKRKFFDDENSYDADEERSGKVSKCEEVQDEEDEENIIRTSVFNPFSPDGCLNLHENMLAQHQDLDLTTVLRWTSMEVSDFVSKFRFCPPGLGDRIVREEVDGEAFLLLNQTDFVVGLGLTLGPAVKFAKIIHNIKVNKCRKLIKSR